MTAVPAKSEDGSAEVIVARPAACPVTRPVDETEAVDALDEVHVAEVVRFLVVPSE
jgi:hypothetical protein